MRQNEGWWGGDRNGRTKETRRRETDRQTDRQRYRETETHRERQRDRKRQTETETVRDREKGQREREGRREGEKARKNMLGTYSATKCTRLCMNKTPHLKSVHVYVTFYLIKP